MQTPNYQPGITSIPQDPPPPPTDYRTGSSDPRTQAGTKVIQWNAWQSCKGPFLPLSLLDPRTCPCIQVKAGKSVVTLEYSSEGMRLKVEPDDTSREILRTWPKAPTRAQATKTNAQTNAKAKAKPKAKTKKPSPSGPASKSASAANGSRSVGSY